jgi:hypothetical protein
VIEPLRSRLVAADLAWSRLPLPDGSVSSVPRTAEQAAGMAVLVVLGWLSDMAEGLSWLPVDPYAVEDHRDIAARVLRIQLDELKGAGRG